MQLIKYNNDEVIRRLRLVMVAVILFSIFNTLIGQPQSFWLHPETAIRGDGLSIYNETNRTFEFFLGMGWQPYLLANLVYVLAAFLLVTILPKRLALIVIFSFIFGHFFVGCNWLAVRWHLGIQGFTLYAIAFAVVIVLSAFPKQTTNTNQIIKGLCWVAIGVIALDFTNTLLGQPLSYWHNTSTVNEANPISRFFLIQGWFAYVMFGMVYCLGVYWLASALPKKWALTCIFYFILVSFIGGSNWFFYVWRMGMESPVIYGIILSTVIVNLAFYPISRNNQIAQLLFPARDKIYRYCEEMGCRKS